MFSLSILAIETLPSLSPSHLVKTPKVQVIDIAISKLGRYHLGIIYINSSEPLAVGKIDHIHQQLTEVCEPIVGLLDSEVVLTEEARLKKLTD